MGVRHVDNRHGGFVDYNDVTTQSTPITLPDSTWTTLTNDGAGTFTNTGYAPSGVTSMMDTLTGEIDCTQLALGDRLIVRPDFIVTPSINNSTLRFRFLLGEDPSGQYPLPTTLPRLDSGSGIPYQHAGVGYFVYMGDTNTRDNPIALQLYLEGGGTVVNNGVSIGVEKR